MTGSSARRAKVQTKRLKTAPKGQYSRTGRQYLCTMTTEGGRYSHFYSIEPHFILSKKMLPIAFVMGCLIPSFIPLVMGQSNEQIIIRKSKPSVVFQRVGTLYPTLNFAHIRVSANLTELQTVSTVICQTARFFARLSNYTDAEVLKGINPAIAEAFRSAEESNQYPSNSFLSIMRVMVNGL